MNKNILYRTICVFAALGFFLSSCYMGVDKNTQLPTIQHTQTQILSTPTPITPTPAYTPTPITPTPAYTPTPDNPCLFERDGLQFFRTKASIELTNDNRYKLTETETDKICELPEKIKSGNVIFFGIASNSIEYKKVKPDSTLDGRYVYYIVKTDKGETLTLVLDPKTKNIAIVSEENNQIPTFEDYKRKMDEIAKEHIEALKKIGIEVVIDGHGSFNPYNYPFVCLEIKGSEIPGLLENLEMTELHNTAEGCKNTQLIVSTTVTRMEYLFDEREAGRHLLAGVVGDLGERTKKIRDLYVVPEKDAIVSQLIKHLENKGYERNEKTEERLGPKIDGAYTRYQVRTIEYRKGDVLVELFPDKILYLWVSIDKYNK